jgi:alpha-glucosidase
LNGRPTQPWWSAATLYQIYPRSWADSNGDGVGDLPGVMSRLDYLEWLGVDGIWFSPTMPSPNVDWGYDVSDYCDVHPELGTLDDLDRLVREADERGIRVLLDVVPNHTSDRHPWFVESRSSRDSARRDWYVWADGRDGGPPNNWMSAFGGGAWTFDEPTGQWYLHNFAVGQPDLDWWNDGVRAAFEDILRFWFDRGIAGFRIDVANALIKDRELRDNPPAERGDPERFLDRGQRPVYNFNRPEVHDVYRGWRQVADAYDSPRVFLGETWVPLEDLARYYRNLDLAFNEPFLFGMFEAAPTAAVVAETERVLPAGSWPVWTAGNHDIVRFPTRWCDGDEELTRCVLAALLTLRGCCVLYYGDELGMEETAVPPARQLDVADRPRDGCRTPMPWVDAPGAGFTEPGVEPWLPFGSLARNVEAQRDDPGSVLALVRDLIRLKREREDLRSGAYEQFDASAGVWAFRRGTSTVVALNTGDAAALIDVTGNVLIGTRRERNGERVEGLLELGPREAVILDTA